MGVEVQNVTNPDGYLIPRDEQSSGKWAGKFDILLGGMAPTAKRAKVMIFQAVYRNVRGVVAVNRDDTSIATTADASESGSVCSGPRSTRSIFSGMILRTWEVP